MYSFVAIPSACYGDVGISPQLCMFPEEEGLEVLETFTYLPSTPKLNDFRKYVAQPPQGNCVAHPSLQETHITTKGSAVIPIPETLHGHALQWIFGKTHEQVASEFQMALIAAYGPWVAHSVFPQSLQKVASINHPSVFIQKTTAYILQNTTQDLNRKLKNITVPVVLSEMKHSPPATLANSEAPPVLPSIESSNQSSLITIALSPLINPLKQWIGTQTGDAIQELIRITPQHVNKAFQEGITVDITLDENPTVPIGGVSYELMKKVIEKADQCMIRNVNRVIQAAYAARALRNYLQESNLITPDEEDKLLLTEQNSQQMLPYVQEISFLPPSEITSQLTSDPLHSLLTRTFNKSAQHIALISTQKNAPQARAIITQAHTATQRALSTITQISETIINAMTTPVASSYPSTHYDLTEELEHSLEPLITELQSSVETIEQAARDIGYERPLGLSK
ncbi:MAG TPA: hypothetical protein VJK54_03280 [Chthoniobacterales bacterium]|nr:hypothetical protein [Chthoniobacterales bacterium]